MPTPTEILNVVYQNAKTGTVSDLLTSDQQIRVTMIVDHAESHKGVLAALITSLVRKIQTPTQDVRLHKTIFPDGYSGRSYDFNFITPFIRQKFGRLAMAESGWLTRSIEQPHPFTLDFPGKIQNIGVKQAFLEILDDVEMHSTSAKMYLTALFRGLILLVGGYESMLIVSRQTQFITVARIMHMLESHFNHNYHAAGGSLLPVLALFSVYRAMMDLPRYMGKMLIPLKGHTTSDVKSTSIGDIEILSADGQYFEGVEVKFNKPITPDMVQIASEKFMGYPLERYYLLTTSSPNTIFTTEIDAMIEDIRQRHGCEIIVNGVVPTLKYYLRLLPDPAAFLTYYGESLNTAFNAGTDLKQEHVKFWIRLIETTVHS